MDRMIYLSMSGAKATMQRQDVLANNLANVSTVGFRAVEGLYCDRGSIRASNTTTTMSPQWPDICFAKAKRS